MGVNMKESGLGRLAGPDELSESPTSHGGPSKLTRSLKKASPKPSWAAAPWNGSGL